MENVWQSLYKQFLYIWVESSSNSHLDMPVTDKTFITNMPY